MNCFREDNPYWPAVLVMSKGQLLLEEMCGTEKKKKIKITEATGILEGGGSGTQIICLCVCLRLYVCARVGELTCVGAQVTSQRAHAALCDVY